MPDTVQSILTPLQQDFLETYVMKKGVFARNKEKKNAEREKLLQIYQREREVLGKKIAGLADNDTMRQGFSNRVYKADEIIKGKGKTTEKLAQATKELQLITLDLLKHIANEEKNAYKFSIPGQVRFFVAKGTGEIYDISNAFNAEVDTVVEDIRKLAGGTDLVIPEPKLALKMSNAVSSAIGTINPLSTAAASGDMDLELAKSIIDDVVKNIRQTDTDLRKELAEFAGSEEIIKQHIENVKKADAIKQDIDSMGSELEKLLNWGSPKAAELIKKAENLRKSAHPEHGDLDGLKKSCDDLFNEIKGARIDATGAYNKKKEELDKRLDAMWKTVEAFRKKHAKEAMPEQAEEFAFVANAARQALDAGKNVNALPAIEKMVQDAENIANDLGSMGMINGEVKKAIAEAKKIVGKRNGKKGTIRVNAWATLDAEIKSFESDWPSKRPASARSEAMDLVLRCGQEETREAGQHTWIESQQRRITEARNYLKQVEAELKKQVEATGKKFAGYDGALKKELDDAEAFLTKEALSWQQPTETKIGKAQVAILELLERLKGSQVESMKALKELSDEYDENVAAKDQEIIDLKALHQSISGWKDVSKAQYKASKTAKTHKDDYDQLMKQVSGFISEVKTASKTTDPKKRAMDSGTAEKRYRGYQQRMQTILKDPPKINRKSLGSMDKTWKDAVGRLTENQKTLINTVRNDFVGKLEDEAKKKEYLDGLDKFNQQIARVIATFDLAAFDNAAKVLGDDDATEQDRLRHREIALNMVRLNRDRITSNPLIQACVQNPFNVPGFASPPYRALNQIDLEVQRGV